MLPCQHALIFVYAVKTGGELLRFLLYTVKVAAEMIVMLISHLLIKWLGKRI